MSSRRINASKTWSLTAQGIDQIFDLADRVAWVLPERDPEDPVIKGLLDAFVMTEVFRHRGFAVASRTTQSGGDRNRLRPLLVKHFGDQCIEFLSTRHKVRRQIFHHERHPHLLTARIEVIDKLCPFMSKVIEVSFAHPMWQAGKV